MHTLLTIQDTGIGVSAHPACIRTLIVVKRAFVILRWFERHCPAAVTQNDKADLLALEKFFYHKRRGERVDRVFRVFVSMGNCHAFAGGESVGLNDDGQREAGERALRLLARGGGSKLGRWNP